MRLVRIDDLLHARRPLQYRSKMVDLLLDHETHEEVEEGRDDPRQLAAQAVVELDLPRRPRESGVGQSNEGESIDEVLRASDLEEEGEDGPVNFHRLGTATQRLGQIDTPRGRSESTRRKMQTSGKGTEYSTSKIGRASCRERVS